ncbi:MULTISPECIES: 6-phosphofructokinase [Pelosinus]|uniref:ATP-dependent 6-phosphofructokinase n=1 Tax=Pelosinus fermentans B4 TaxID=1149862 RepID=I9AY03_9FIRM|nr:MULTISPECIES: 6-phosphofructokinase [Pelosinus]EIW17777.1 6-phosphofructokinase [Pelosinus fermentans B4]EIW23739.1 6-phosphofructokinase [Pelosinus fermentans A11]OAM94662.1 6-phosphofructokinase [Pelosinus fermentans DSM 17108]SDR14837.1 6-phosphofructokinase [Pelosinus fermentans]
MKKIGVLTSGGDAPGMNAAIRAIVRTGIYHDLKVFGIQRGYTGLLHGEIKEMHIASVGDIIHRGGTILKTSRCEEMKTEAGINKAIGILEKNEIDGLIVIGGDGSFQGVNQLGRGNIKVMGIPGTIDNDLAYTDYTIGFDTAVNTVLDSISKIRDTSMSHEKVTIIEVMGRHCGDIALYAGLAGGAESILVPEEQYEVKKICEKMLQGRKRGKAHNIIMLAEGRGSAAELQKEILNTTGIESRVTVLGYLQRGGVPTAVDRILASRMGAMAVNLLIEGKSNRAIGIKDNHLINIDIMEALMKRKIFDQEMYNLSQILSI